MTNTQNTSRAVVATEASGAGALAPAPEALTIREEAVRIFLERANPVGDALHHFEAARRRSSAKGSAWSRNYEAERLLRLEWNRIVEVLRDRGGLLRLGRGV